MYINTVIIQIPFVLLILIVINGVFQYLSSDGEAPGRGKLSLVYADGKLHLMVFELFNNLNAQLSW